MKKYHNKIQFLISIILIGCFLHANPYMPDLYSSKSNGVIWALVAFPSLLIEYLIVRILLSPQVKFGGALSSFFIINLITFPITQFLGQFLIWFAELVPLILEPVMYKNCLQGIKVPKLKSKIIAANLISFGLGVLFYQVIPILYRTYY
jgi:hypothetical protein